jgi:hypothetical protein
LPLLLLLLCALLQLANEGFYCALLLLHQLLV